MKTDNVKKLTCACCGNLAKGRQWWNQDTGFGICERCANWIEERHGKEYVREAYGNAGVHHSLGKG